jgi:hypothetical protein
MSPGLAVPAVQQLDDPVAGGGAGDQVEPVGLGDALDLIQRSGVGRIGLGSGFLESFE